MCMTQRSCNFPDTVFDSNNDPYHTLSVLFYLITENFFITIGTIHEIANVDYKKRSESESAAFDFRIKKVSAYGVDNNILEEIHKFLFPFQHLIVKEACAMMN